MPPNRRAAQGLCVSLFILGFVCVAFAQIQLPENIWDDPRTQENIRRMGPPPIDSPKILQGEKTKKGQLLDVVGLTTKDSNSAFCSGVLINPSMVLTAKHCVCRGTNLSVVLVGEVDRTARRYPIARQVPKPDECGGEITSDDLDISLLILANPLPDVGVRKLATGDLIDEALSYRIVGFGDYEIGSGKFGHGEKHQAVVPATSNACLGRFKTPRIDQTDAEFYGCRKGVEIVAGTRGLGRDTCGGDSGGPLLVARAGPLVHGRLNIPAEELLLAGVTSRSVKPPSTDTIPCGDGGIYVRITETVVNWINKQKTKE